MFRLKMAFLALVFVGSYAGLVMTMMSIGHAADWPIVRGVDPDDPTLHDSDPIGLYVRCDPCVVHGDPGGSIERYMEVVKIARTVPKRVYRFDGTCWSACTLMAAELATTGQACVTKRAVFGIHQAGSMGMDGRFDEEHGREVIPYPRPFQGWIDAHGGEPNRGFLIARYRDLKGMIPTCRA